MSVSRYTIPCININSIWKRTVLYGSSRLTPLICLGRNALKEEVNKGKGKSEQRNGGERQFIANELHSSHHVLER